MYDDDLIIGLVKESFGTQTDEVNPPIDLARTVRSQLARRRVITATSAAAIVLVIALGAALLAGGGGAATRTKQFRLSGYTFQVPADARTGSACLDAPSQWARGWTPKAARGTISVGMLSVRADGTVNDACVAAVLTYTTAPPPAIDTSKTNDGRTIYIAAPTGDTRVAYTALSADQSAQAAELIHGPTSVPYFVIGEMPSDNDQSVLDTVIQRAQQILVDR